MQLNGIFPDTNNKYTFLESNAPIYHVYVKTGEGIRLKLYLN